MNAITCSMLSPQKVTETKTEQESNCNRKNNKTGMKLYNKSLRKNNICPVTNYLMGDPRWVPL